MHFDFWKRLSGGLGITETATYSSALRRRLARGKQTRHRVASDGRATRQEQLEGRHLLAGDLVINEFMADNVATITDEDGTFSDWIELHNTTGSPISLNGWFLTDDAATPTKWQFPVADFPNDTIAGGGYLVVWASGKDRAGSGAEQEIHTNFKLSASGEYLALVRPDGATVEHAYAPSFPAQLPDESYGIGTDVDTTHYLTSGDVGRFHVPADGSLGSTWKDLGFNDGGWTTVNTAIGFQSSGAPVEAPIGYWNFDDNTSDQSGNGNAASLFNGATFSSDVRAGTGGTKSLVFDGSNDYASIGPTFNVNESAFTVSMWFKPDASASNRGIFSVASTGIPTAAANQDRSLHLSGSNIAAHVKSPTFPAGENIVSTGQNYTTTSAWHHLVYTFGPGVGQRIYVDGNLTPVASGSSQSSILTSQDRVFIGYAQPGLVNDYFKGKIDEVAIWNVNLTAAQAQALYNGLSPLESAAFTGLIDTDVSGTMLGANATSYLRMPITVADAGAIDSLTLKVRYDDGFLAYLNGVQVASRNAPGAPTFNSSATAEHPNAQAVVYEEIDLTPHIGLLNTGANNVLAFQALNVSASQSDFLLDAELVDVDVLGQAEHYFSTPSPGAANDSSFFEVVADTKFDHDRGFYDAPFTLAITTDTPGATIRYTINGATPTTTTGTIYTGPITVSGTAVGGATIPAQGAVTIRAIAYKPGFVSTDVDTETYIFLGDLVTQAANGVPPAGWPADNAVNGQDMNYGFDPDIVNNPNFGGQNLIDALKSVPTISIVTDQANLTNSSTGIYVNPGQDGISWERPASVELINDYFGDGFQINAGIRIRGGFSRTVDNPKHAFRLFFREEYGAAKLEYPLFGDDGASVFDKVDLRTGQNYSWSFQNDGRMTLTRDIFSRDTQRDMGEPYTRGLVYHLYLNGVYWGLYQTQERSEAAYGETYLGGVDSDYDVVKVEAGPYDVNATDGTMTAWTAFYNSVNQIPGMATQTLRYNRFLQLQGKNPDGSENLSFPVYLDVRNLIDYMLVIEYGGNLDAAISNFLGNNQPNNWYGMYNRNARDGFKFFAHDSEHTLLNANENRFGPYAAGSTNVVESSPQWLHQQLAFVDEYRVAWMDRVQELFFNGGALSPEAAQARLEARNAELSQAIIAESARWGDSRNAVPYDRDDWLSATNAIRTGFVPQRSTILIQQMNAVTANNFAGITQAAPLYPSSGIQSGGSPDPHFFPVFQINGQAQHGGHIVIGDQLTMSVFANTPGTIYYTLNGADPRQVGGAVAPTALTYSGPISLTGTTRVKARTLSPGGEWSALENVVFGVDASALRITEIMYHPSPGGAFPADQYEFIELANTGAAPLDVDGVKFTGGISYSFPDATLAAGQRVVLAINSAAFVARYPSVSPYGVYGGALDNGGERLALVDATGATILDFRCSDNWYPVTDATASRW